MFNQKYIVLFIDRNKIQLFGGNLTGIVNVDLPETIINDIDVLRKDDLYTLIKQCVKQYALTGGQIIMVLSGAMYFEKMFPDTDNPQTDSDILKFFETIPYESVWTKVYQTEKGKLAVAVNKELYEAFRQGFLLQGLSVKTLIPAFALGQHGTKRVLDKAMAMYIQGGVDMLVKQSLLDTQDTNQPGAHIEQEPSEGKPKSNIRLLLGVFGVLIFVLLIVIATQLS